MLLCNYRPTLIDAESEELNTDNHYGFSDKWKEGLEFIRIRPEKGDIIHFWAVFLVLEGGSMSTAQTACTVENEESNRLSKIVALLAFISSASTAATLISPALPDLQHSMHLSSRYVTATVSLFLVGYTIGQLIYGPFANKLGRVKSLRLGMVVNLIGIGVSMISIHNQQIWYLLIGRLLSALGVSAGLVCTITLINDVFPEQKAKQILSYATLSFTIGIYLGVYIGGILTSHFGWEATLYALFLHGLSLLCLTFYIEAMERASISQRSFSIKNMLAGYMAAIKSKQLIAFSLILALATVISYLYATEAPLIAQNKKYFDLTAGEYGSWNTINAIGMIIGALLAVKVLKYYSAIAVLLAGITLSFIVCCQLLFLNQMNLMTPFLFFLSTGFLFIASGLIYPSAVFYASNSISCKASASAMANFINLFVATIFVTVMGSLAMQDFFKLFFGIVGYTVSAFVVLLVSQIFVQK